MFLVLKCTGVYLSFQIYFKYIQTWMFGLMDSPEMSKRLKNVLEEEWNFTKLICPHVRGGEANAGNRFWYGYVEFKLNQKI